MTELTELVERVKEEGLGVVLTNHNRLLGSYGLDDAHTFSFYGCMPSQNLHWITKHFLPERLRGILKAANARQDITEGGITIVHYPLSCWNIKDRFHREENREFKKEVKKRFDSPTCVYQNRYDGFSIFMGEKDLTQQVMDYCKTKPHETLLLLEKTLKAMSFPSKLETGHRKAISQIHIYDLLQQPKETHFDLK